MNVTHDYFINHFVHKAIQYYIDANKPYEDWDAEFASVQILKGPGEIMKDTERVWLNVDGVPYVISAKIWSSS